MWLHSRQVRPVPIPLNSLKQPPATPDLQNLPDPSLCDADGVVRTVGADLEHAERLVRLGRAATTFDYGRGGLVLWIYFGVFVPEGITQRPGHLSLIHI